MRLLVAPASSCARKKRAAVLKLEDRVEVVELPGHRVSLAATAPAG
jgi:hypothetical protein